MQLAFHRLDHSSPKHAWWKPLVTGLIGAAIFAILLTAIVFGWLAIRLVDQPQLLNDQLALIEPLQQIELTDPLTFALFTVLLAALIPAVFLARLIMGPRPVGLVSSVAGRLRWRWLARCILLAIVPFGVIFGIQFLLPAAGSGVTPVVTSTTVLLVVLALVLTPLQATGEEYVFRGYLMQTLGAWLKHPAWAILIPVPLFAIGHTQYGLLGQLDVALFALFAGYLTWRTGGLEAAIVAHVINNTALFVLGAFVLVDNGESEGSIIGLLSTVVIMGSFTALVVWQVKRTGLETTRTVLPIEPPMEHWAPPASAFPTTPGNRTDIPPVDSSREGWPPEPPRPVPVERRDG